MPKLIVLRVGGWDRRVRERENLGWLRFVQQQVCSGKSELTQ